MIFMISLALGGPLRKSFDERLGTFYLLQYVFAIRVVVYIQPILHITER